MRRVACYEPVYQAPSTLCTGEASAHLERITVQHEEHGGEMCSGSYAGFLFVAVKPTSMPASVFSPIRGTVRRRNAAGHPDAAAQTRSNRLHDLSLRASSPAEASDAGMDS